MFLQGVGDTVESGLKKIISAFENKIANPIDGIRISVNSVLVESLKSKNAATSDCEPSRHRENACIPTLLISISVIVQSSHEGFLK